MKTFSTHHFYTILILLLTSCGDLMAHSVNYNMELKPLEDVVSYYIVLGFQHILPLGLDHILFVMCIFLMDSRLKTVIIQASCFTIAHTITLILTSKDIISPPAEIIEPIIAISIAFIALENIYVSKISPWRYGVVFLFGLIHGMGFANALNNIGLPRDTFYTSLISFNVGVELGQLAVIFLAWLLIGKIFSNELWYRKRIIIPLSLTIATIAAYWTIERLFFS